MSIQQKNTTPFPWKRNILALFGLAVVLYSGYQLSNRFHLTEPHYLPLTALDYAIPFALWTVWPYFALVLLAFLPVGIGDTPLFWRTLIAFSVALTLNIAVWILFPTVYDRPPMPDGNDLTTFAYRWLCSIDTPANCLPSGHITSPAIGCWAIAKVYPRYRYLIWAVFALLSVTILTTKQHYIYDLPAGLLTAWIGIRASGPLYARFRKKRNFLLV